MIACLCLKQIVKSPVAHSLDRFRVPQWLVVWSVRKGVTRKDMAGLLHSGLGAGFKTFVIVLFVCSPSRVLCDFASQELGFEIQEAWTAAFVFVKFVRYVSQWLIKVHNEGKSLWCCPGFCPRHFMFLLQCEGLSVRDRVPTSYAKSQGIRGANSLRQTELESQVFPLLV